MQIEAPSKGGAHERGEIERKPPLVQKIRAQIRALFCRGFITLW
ncbi:hypothetical protein U717_16630 [Rhodobacter capsulatus R121]|nr:hypothetical protein U714_16665 [Rhodobacter capsulatus DE442]ETD74896.1 hypothetical protein U717_16630 [Rhodobacter capsulatus R121]ETD83900.1 hypothetical protein U703_07595 [Rhodobacter capsulatus YW1]ETD87517.1 hypothetical protein U716_00940 [Rhodobacter capsulatus B6]ETD88899.1 hypothetical protein U713_12020 [Rhodobacter capsulatus YW2]ETE52637.1 hypothetical protein U715_16625 [Rhodobacter capsulatus Y262]